MGIYAERIHAWHKVEEARKASLQMQRFLEGQAATRPLTVAEGIALLHATRLTTYAVDDWIAYEREPFQVPSWFWVACGALLLSTGAVTGAATSLALCLLLLR